VEKSPSSQRSPTSGLLLGLIITLAAIVAYSAYTTVQLSGLRRLQSNLVDRNRKDSLQLLRLQNDLNSVALAMRDMLDAGEPYPLSAWEAQFERLRGDLDSALRVEEENAAAYRTPEQRQYLRQQLAQFWDAVERMFALARGGKDQEAREQPADPVHAEVDDDDVRQEALVVADDAVVDRVADEDPAAGLRGRLARGGQHQDGHPRPAAAEVARQARQAGPTITRHELRLRRGRRTAPCRG